MRNKATGLDMIVKWILSALVDFEIDMFTKLMMRNTERLHNLPKKIGGSMWNPSISLTSHITKLIMNRTWNRLKIG